MASLQKNGDVLAQVGHDRAESLDQGAGLSQAVEQVLVGKRGE